MSSSYERMNYITSFGFSLRWRIQFIQSIEGTDKKIEVLDLLTGMGETWQAVKHNFPNAKITALDFSEGMLRYAHKRNQTKYQKSIELVLQDALKSNLPSNHYDVITCAFGLKTFNEEQLQALAIEVKRLLKPDGKFSFIEVSIPKNRFLKFLYGIYLGKMIPVLGKVFLGNPREYRMLWQYTSRFKNCDSALNIFNQQGLRAYHKRYFFGCASGITGSKN